MKATLFSGIGFLLLAVGLRAATPPTITRQPANATFAKAATARFYVSASSPNDGYLTCKWFRSEHCTGRFQTAPKN